jgi:hypothetical protein
MHHEGGRTIAVSCHSTRAEQIELFNRLFEPYGYVRAGIPRKGKSVYAEAYLN